MIIPYLKKNGKYILYDTDYDFSSNDKEYRQNSDNINHSGMGNEEFDFINPFVEGFAIASKNDKPCFINLKGDVIRTEHEYFELTNFQNGIAAVSRELSHGYNRYRFVNKNGIEILNEAFEEYSYLKKGFIEVTQYSDYGYDSHSQSIIISGVSNGLMDYTGYLLIRPIKSTQFYPDKKYIKVCYSSVHHSSSSYFDYNGNQIFDDRLEEFEYIDDFYENRSLAVLKNSKEYVIIDDDFNTIKNLGITNQQDLGEAYTIFEYFSDSHFFRGLCAIKMNGKWGFINTDGEFVLTPKYDFLGAFTDIKSWSNKTNGCAVAGKKKGSEIKYGAINSDFEEIIEFDFDEINLFHENIAEVRIKDKWGCINSEGNIVVPIEYNFVSYCSNGFIKVGLGDFDSNYFVGQYGFYNRAGLKITKIIYQHLGQFNNGFAIAKKHEKYGLINEIGVEVIKCFYDNLSGDSETGYLAEKDGIEFYIESSGRQFRAK